MFAMVFSLEQATVTENLTTEPGSDGLVVQRCPDSCFSHELRGEEVGDRRKGLFNDFRRKGSISTIINGGFAPNGLSVFLLQARLANAGARGQVILALGGFFSFGV